MKKLITSFALLFCSLSLIAGHEGGPVVISYKNIPGQPLQYEITIRAFYTTYGTAIAPPSQVVLEATSSCFSYTSYTLPRVGSGSPISMSGSEYCGYGSYFNGLVEYKSTVTLPAHCADILLSISAGPGRFDFVQNLQSNFDLPYFYTKLNTLLGPNNSPSIPDLDLVQTACLNTPITLFGYTDADGDSLYFEKAIAQKKVGTTIVNFSYLSGYSKNRPFGNTIPYVLDPVTGIVQSQVGAVGNFALATKYKEYRYDTAASSMVMVGEGIINYVVTGTSTCAANNSISILHESVPNSDSIQCGSNKIRFIGSRQLSRSSLSTSGSDIRVISNKQGNLAISGATLIQDSIVEVTLGQAPPLGDTLRLVAKIGTDGNVIISRCGTELTAYDDTLTYFTRSGALPLAVSQVSSQFLNTQFNSSSSTADSLWWDFGDGNGSSSGSGNHSYSSPGTYTVNLIAFGVCSTTDTSTSIIQVCDSVSAKFMINQLGDTVSFYVLNPAGIANVYWDFGDGQNAAGDSITHVYTAGGTYNSTLLVTTICGDSVTYSMTIETCLAPLASWTYNLVSTTTSGMTIDFDGTASSNAATFMWDFGDGTIDNTTLTPRHVYQTPGLHYYVKLTVDNNCQQSSEKGFRLNQIGITEFENNLVNLKVYPNPVQDVLKVNWGIETMAKSINIYDLQGRKLVSSQISKTGIESTEISVKTLIAGSYILQIETIDGKTFQTLVQKE